MRQLTSADYKQFIAAAPVAVIHFDTEWNAGHRAVIRQRMQDAEHSLGQQALFAEVDCDRSIDLAQSIDVMNVPLVAYYRGGDLVAALVGYQDIRARVERILQGEHIGYDDGLTNPATQS
jgi:thioredoxin-like negative regulator of GroEL